MAIMELELREQGIRHINIELHKRFQQWSLAAIRSHRRQPEYRVLLQSCSKPEDSSDIGEMASVECSNQDSNASVSSDDSTIIEQVNHTNELWKKIPNTEVGLNYLEKRESTCL